MKKMKISILAIVALMAMSFTVATHKGGFSKAIKKSAQVFVCQTDLGRNMYFSAYISCLNGMVKQQGITPCFPPGHGGFDCAKNLIPNPQGIPCPGGPRFCCAFASVGNCPPNCRPVRVFCMP